jgi:predicted DNA-binding transcriptional regulator AlpA
MDEYPVLFDDVSTVEHGRSYMSNRVINRSGIAAPTLAMRANAPVFSAEGRPHGNGVGDISEQSNYPTYPTNFRTYVPTAERTLHLFESTTLSQSITVPGNDQLMNARQVAAKLGVSERWVRDHTTRRSPRIRGLKMGSLMRYRLADVEAFLAELDTQPSSRPSRFRV